MLASSPGFPAFSYVAAEKAGKPGDEASGVLQPTW